MSQPFVVERLLFASIWFATGQTDYQHLHVKSPMYFARLFSRQVGTGWDPGEARV